MNNGWIKIHRSLTEWEWYHDTNVVRVFLHILLRANHKTKKWQGHTVERGELITSYGHLADELGLSVRNIRTVISKLKSTGELTSKSTSKFTKLTICQYETYQSFEGPTDKQTDKPSDKQATSDRQQLKNEKNEKKKGKEVLVEEKELTKEEIRQAREINKQWAIEVGLIKG